MAKAKKIVQNDQMFLKINEKLKVKEKNVK
jgi:hypothetical protein